MKINSEPVYIIGLSCFYHDSAAVLIKDGQLIAAAHEERFTRKKHDDSFPKQAINYCLKEAGITINNVSYIGFYDKPILKFERIISSFVDSWPFGYKHFIKAMPIWLRKKMWIKNMIRKDLGYQGPIYFAKHHLSHAASSFFVSPFDQAAILIVDGVGEWATTTIATGSKNEITLKEEIVYPESLGLFYSVITYYLGFKPNSAEYKVMGLAPYGRPIFKKELEKIFQVCDDGSFFINKKIIDNYYNLDRFEKKLAKLVSFPRRQPHEPLEQHHKDLAASLQDITNKTMIKMACYVYNKTKVPNLCLAGGVALNCTANSEILKQSGFENIYIQPAAGDAGGALGVAYYIWHQVLKKPRCFVMSHCNWGPEFSNKTIKSFLNQKGIPYYYYDNNEELLTVAANFIDQQKIIGWFQGRMEWGPRALGSRSILADARNKDNWQRVNLKIKFRESFRPFAPSVIEERHSQYFDFPTTSPFMLFVAPVNSNDLPAITHVNKTARLQTVNQKDNPLYHQLIQRFEKLTNCPVIINTSFNIRGEPIVCTHQDAFSTFLKTDLDYLIMGNFVLDKKEVSKKFKATKPEISHDID